MSRTHSQGCGDILRLIDRIRADEAWAQSSSCGDGSFDRAMQREAQARSDAATAQLLHAASQSWDVWNIARHYLFIP